MSLNSLLTKRYLSHSGVKSIVVMTVISIIGVAVGVAALTLILSVVGGFQKDYKKAILDFNAHVVLLQSGEMPDYNRVMDELQDYRSNPQDAKGWESLKKWVFYLRLVETLKIKLTNIFTDLMEKYPEPGPILKSIFALDPINMSTRIRESGHYPRFLVKKIIEIISLGSRGIEGVTPFIYREGLLASEGRVRGIVIKGIDTKTFFDVSKMKINIFNKNEDIGKALISKDKAIPVVVGSALLNNLGNDKIKILLPGEGFGKLPMEKMFREFRVVGTFESGLYDYDSEFVLMDLSVVQDLFHIKGMVTGIEIRLNDVDKAPVIASILNERFPYPFRATHWAEVNKPIFEAVQLERAMFSLIVGILVIVAAFNIIGALVLKVIHKTRDIAVLKALGVKRSKVCRIFVWQGMVIGLMGVAIGIVLGISLALSIERYHWVPIDPEIYLLSNLPVSISVVTLFFIAFFSIITCYITSKAAANKVSELSIVEGLKKLY